MENKVSLSNIGNNIKIARLKKGFTQEYIADKYGITAKQVSAIECGKSAGSVSLIVNLCNLLEVTPNYIFSGEINNTNDEISVIPKEIYEDYLKLNNENQKFIQNTIKHLYNMQKKR